MPHSMSAVVCRCAVGSGTASAGWLRMLMPTVSCRVCSGPLVRGPRTPGKVPGAQWSADISRCSDSGGDYGRGSLGSTPPRRRVMAGIMPCATAAAKINFELLSHYFLWPSTPVAGLIAHPCLFGTSFPPFPCSPAGFVATCRHVLPVVATTYPTGIVTRRSETNPTLSRLAGPFVGPRAGSSNPTMGGRDDD
jgi:hypothetical protein